MIYKLLVIKILGHHLAFAHAKATGRDVLSLRLTILTDLIVAIGKGYIIRCDVQRDSIACISLFLVLHILIRLNL